jgi:Zn-dependent peptidase ImmA (M78 family)/DNA-binding XRE family transcriptional regulator
VTPVDQRTLGTRLREAREARNWTQRQVADRLQVARTTVVAIEKGERRVKPAELVELAGLYGQPVSDLLQRGAPAEDLAAQLRGALAATPVDSDLLPHLQEFQALCEDYARLEALCEAPLRRRYPPEVELRAVDPEIAAEDVAAGERSRLALGEGSLLNLREVLEADVGLRIFQMDLPPEAAGLFVFTQALGCCVAVSRQHPPGERRASLAREYGHFLTSRHRARITLAGRYERRPAAERFAAAFARAFLVPAAGLRRRFLEVERERSRGVTLGDLCRLAHFYAVSVEAMTRRLEEVRLVPSGTRDRLRLEEPHVREAQRLLGLGRLGADDEILPPRFVALAVEAWQKGDLSEGQLARLLRTDRLGARERVWRLETTSGEGGEPGEPIDLAAPLLARSAG